MSVFEHTVDAAVGGVIGNFGRIVSCRRRVHCPPVQQQNNNNVLYTYKQTDNPAA